MSLILQVLTLVFCFFLPDYLNFLDSPLRDYPTDQFFKEGYQNSDKYNAYLEDIAAVRFYFNRPTAMELVSAPRYVNEYINEQINSSRYNKMLRIYPAPASSGSFFC